MITSPTRHEEEVLYVQYLETIEWLAREYLFTNDERIPERIATCERIASFLKERLEKHDYTQDDIRALRVDNFIKSYNG